MAPVLRFLAPSLHPGALEEITIPFPPSGSAHPIVRHRAVRHGEHSPLGLVKRIVQTGADHVIVADDGFGISDLNFSAGVSDVPTVVRQHRVSGRKGDTWAGLVPSASGVISALSSGLITLHPTGFTLAAQSASLPPLTCLASSSSGATSFAAAGREVDVSVWDVERAFASSSGKEDVTMSEPITAVRSGNGGKAKRKKDALLPGETWRARNLPNDSLSLRPPIHHLSLAYLPDSDTQLVSGTKSGHVRRYDTRQRKPVSNWKVAREGGVGCVCPVGQHELFFSDRAALLGSLDLRTGKLLYTIPSTTTINHLVALPPASPSSAMTDSSSSHAQLSHLALASIASDYSLRVHNITSPPAEEAVGNWRQGRKSGTAGMVGGVGLGAFVCVGWGESDVEDEARVEKNGNGDRGGDEDDDDTEDEDEGGDGVWEGMSEVDDGEDGSDEEVVPVKKPKSGRR